MKTADFLYYFVISFILGIIFAFYFHSLNFWFILFIALVLFVLALNNFLLKKKNLYFFYFTVLLFFVLGFLRYQFFASKHQIDYSKINNFITQSFIVSEEPEEKSYRTKIILENPENNLKFLAMVPKVPFYNYGDKVRVEAWIKKIDNFQNFDYENFLRKDGVLYELRIKNIQKISEHQGNWLKEKLYNFKNNLIERIDKIIGGDEAKLLSGILLGAKENLGNEWLEKFRKTGVIHIVVLSGFNLTILASVIVILLGVLNRKISLFLAIASIALFMLMVGASATVLRAGLMAFLVFIGNYLGKRTEAIRLLFISAFLILLWNPLYLFYDPSFQLSFLATLGLLLLSPVLDKKIPKTENKILKLIREILIATLSVEIFIFPFLIYLMGEISIIAPVVNILVLTLLTPVMIFGLLILLISSFSWNIAIIFGFFEFLILRYFLWIVDIFSNFKYAVLKFDLNFTFVIIFYLIFFVWYLRKYFLNLIRKNEKIDF